MAKRRRKHDRKKIHKHERKAKTKDRYERELEDLVEPKHDFNDSRSMRRSRRNDIFVIVVAIVFILAVIGVYIFYDQYLESESGEESNDYEPNIIPNPNPNNNNGGDNTDYKIPEFETSNPQNPVVILEVRGYGSIVLELYQHKVPKTVQNFLEYVRMGFYNGLIFHRVIDDFMIQGGGFDTELNEQPAINPEIDLEIDSSLRHVDGALAMARKSYGGEDDPEGKNTATCQFYICDGPQSFLDDNYAVFGQVVGGMEHVRSIASVQTHSEKGFDDVPVNDVIINQIFEYFG